MGVKESLHHSTSGPVEEITFCNKSTVTSGVTPYLHW